ncbi:hypothetical protein OPT61_g5716 [Boeremia exigua]|uniref:Uncharacterized protein n=1 Tax=Boeremia exigua TaxID=749465 RepID=A0ACC2I9F2_9PLEO|nr:hypothetical protein OPT61_g5716 [Boeremia exigua]
MSESQPEASLTFDQFCEQLCEGCRVVRWLGKADPPPRLAWKEHEIHVSENCLLCQQLSKLLPRETASKIHVRLGSVQQTISESDSELTTYDLLHFLVDTESREFRTSFGIFSSRAIPSLTLTTVNTGLETIPELHLAIRALQTDTIDYGKIRCWLDACMTHHNSTCMSTGTVVVPGLKLIDCRDGAIISLGEANLDYAALSYVWGASDPTGTSSLEYPATILDSMAVTKALGLRYLWVDRYCIDQENATEKLVQINLMDRIYEQAQFTIIAATGDTWSGLPGVGRTTRGAQQRLRLGDMELLSMPSINLYYKEIPWSTRAWTFQEGSVSRRKLLFFKGEVVYLCEQMQCFEGLDQSPSPWSNPRYNVVSDGYLRSMIPSVYRSHSATSLQSTGKLLEGYCNRDMSFSSDAIKAFLGVLNATRTTHYWGVPIGPLSSSNAQLTMDLIWFNVEPIEQRSEFPSWSWARWNGIKMFDRPEHACDVEVEIRLNSRQWANISQTNVIQGNVNKVSSSMTLRMTGSTVLPCFALHDTSWSATVQTQHGITLSLKCEMDRKETLLVDTHDAMLLFYEDIVVRQDSWIHIAGIALIIVPHEGNFIRVGLARYPRLESNIKSSIEGTLGFGPVALANATRRTIYLN